MDRWALDVNYLNNNGRCEGYSRWGYENGQNAQCNV